MATYLPGITDYIPDIQPFKPDYNFYQAALQTKEGQYKAGYDKVSSLYGTLLNAEMLREPDIEKRDRFFNKIENEIQRLSSVDLSLSENVDQAYTVFQPLIDDKNITKDIAFTKMYRSQKQLAENSRLSADGKWWEEGARAVDYMADEFSKADDPTALAMSNPRYTPYVDVVKKGMGMIKDMNLNVQTVSWDKSSKYIVTTKNGSQVTIPLHNLLVAGMGSDPAIGDVYRTKAYVQRKDFTRMNAEAYGGDENQAERAYLEEHRAEADDLNLALQEITNETLKELGIKREVMEDKIKAQGALPNSKKKSVLEVLQEESQATEATQSHIDEGLALTNPQELKDADIHVLRSRVDGAVANIEMSKAMMGLAKTWASLNSTQTVEADPFAKSAFDHTLAVDRMKSQYLLDSERDFRKYGYDKNLKAMDLYGKDLKKKANALYGNPENNIWKPVDQGSTDSNAKLTTVNLETLQGVTGTIVQDKLRYIKESYLVYDGMRKDKNPKTQQFGEMMLKNFLGDDAEATMRTLMDPQNPNNYNEAYGKAVKVNSGNTEYMGAEQVIRLNSMSKGVNNQLDVLKSIDDQSKINNLEALKYLKTLEKDADSVDANLFINDEGRAATSAEFNQKYEARYGTLEGSAERFKGLTNHFTKVLNESGSKVIKPYNSSFTASAGGGIMYAGNTSIGLDSADPESEGYRTALSLQDDIFNNPLATVSDPDALPVLSKFFNEFINNTYETKDNKRPAGVFTYEGMADNDRNKIGYRIKMDIDWLEENKGTKKEHGLTWSLYNDVTGKWKDTVRITLPKSSAKSSIARASQFSPADYQIGLGPIVVDEFADWGGTRSIEKDKDGGYTITGTMKYFDEEKREWSEFSKVDYVPKGVPVQVVVNAATESLRINALKQKKSEEDITALYGTRDVDKLLQAGR